MSPSFVCLLLQLCLPVKSLDRLSVMPHLTFLSRRRLCAEIPEQWADESSPEATLLDLVRKLCVFCLEHSAESEACDMLMEIEKIDMLLELISEDVHERVCLYLTR